MNSGRGGANPHTSVTLVEEVVTSTEFLPESVLNQVNVDFTEPTFTFRPQRGLCPANSSTFCPGRD